MPTDLPENDRLSHYGEKMLFLSLVYVIASMAAIVATYMATQSGWWTFVAFSGLLSQLALAGIVMTYSSNNIDDLDGMLSQIREDLLEIKKPPPKP